MLRVLGFYRHAWPVQRGGSEVAAHRVLSWLADRGHDVSAVVTHQRGIPTDGVNYLYGNRRAVMNAWSQADVVLTHQSASGEAVELSEQYGVPVLHWSHNWEWFNAWRDRLRPGRDVVAWNSYTLAAHESQWKGRSIVLRPPVFPERYQRSTGDRVTQVNLNRLKGGELFWNVAAELPDMRFMAVVGGWMEQLDRSGQAHHPKHAVQPLAATAPKHVQILGTTEDMESDVWPQTRVLIVPTGRVNDRQTGESWGLVAAEATCCGIPVVATRSPGMEELLDGTGILLDDPDDVGAWVEAIREADTHHDVYADDALDRALDLDPTDELIRLEDTLLEMAG